MDPWEHVKAWRAFRERVARHEKPSYDAYPGRELPVEIKFYVEGRDANGRLLREYVYLDGYSIHQLNWKAGARRGGVLVTDWFASRMLESLIRLSVRLDEARDAKKEQSDGHERPGTR